MEDLLQNPQSRKWLITINNHVEKGFSRDEVINILNNEKKLVYSCFCEEIGKEGTPHIHIFVQYEFGKRFSTMRNKFKGSHLDMCKGSPKENRDYIRKEGKYSQTEKKETNLIDTFFEIGELKEEKQGQRTDIEIMYERLQNGNSINEIINDNPKMIRYLKQMNDVNNLLLKEKFSNKWRDLDVTYIFGTSGSGKSRYVMDKYGYSNVYRVTDYKHPFDSYNGQDIIVFEEYREDLPIKDMLKYLDGYPCELPCRFSNKWACFSKVYIISNIPIEKQYENIKEKETETWKAWMRRIHHFGVFYHDDHRYFDNYFDYIGGFEYIRL